MNNLIRPTFAVLTFCILFTLSFMSHADDYLIHCPTIEELKNFEFGMWLPLYKDSEELAMDSDVNVFREALQTFDNAHWSADYLEQAHCMYRGNNLMVDRIVFAQDAWRPVNDAVWSWVLQGRKAECHAVNPEECVYIKF